MKRLLCCALLFAACSKGIPGLQQRPDGGTVCQNDESVCPVGTRCTNGVCASTCTGGSGCAADQYCEGSAAPLDICAPALLHTCEANIDCPLPQVCSDGLCTSFETNTEGGQPCVIGGDPDGCKSDAICTPVQGFGAVCVSFAACLADGGCGTPSYLCNAQPDGGFIFAGKEKLCLSGRCFAPADCDVAQLCFHEADAGSALPGFCQYGTAGDACDSDNDCASYAGCKDGHCIYCSEADAGPIPDGGIACR